MDNSAQSQSVHTSHLLRSTTILLEVIQRTEEFSTLCSLRLTCRAIYSLICTYESSILLAVAREMCHDCPCLLRTPFTSHNRPSLEWLLDIMLKRLAAIAVDRARCTSSWGIPAADPLGDNLRERVANGWRVLRRLSIIAQQVYRLPDPLCTARHANLSGFKVQRPARPANLVTARETLILKTRRDLVRSLSTQEVVDFGLMHDFMERAFSNINFGFGMLADLNARKCASVTMRTSWINWLILRDGPSLFEKLWGRYNGPRAQAIESIQRQWRDRTEATRDIEKVFARKINSELETRHLTQESEKHAWQLKLGFEDVYHAGQVDRAARGVADCGETMDKVPFFVNGLPPMPVAFSQRYYRLPLRGFKWSAGWTNEFRETPRDIQAEIDLIKEKLEALGRGL